MNDEKLIAEVQKVLGSLYFRIRAWNWKDKNLAERVREIIAQSEKKMISEFVAQK